MPVHHALGRVPGDVERLVRVDDVPRDVVETGEVVFVVQVWV